MPVSTKRVSVPPPKKKIVRQRSAVFPIAIPEMPPSLSRLLRRKTYEQDHAFVPNVASEGEDARSTASAQRYEERVFR